MKQPYRINDVINEMKEIDVIVFIGTQTRADKRVGDAPHHRRSLQRSSRHLASAPHASLQVWSQARRPASV